MPVPTTIADLSTTASSNSPAGSDAIGTSLDDYLRGIQAILKESGAALYTATGTDTIAVTASPSFGSYFTGMRVWFKSAAANTGAVTLNVNGLGAKAITKTGTTALAAGDIPNGAVVCVSYDGTQFQLLAVNASYAKLDTAQNFTAPQRSAILTDNDLSFDLSAKQNFKATPTAGGTLTFTNQADGLSGSVILVNGSNYAIAAHANTKISTTALTRISATGTYRIDYLSDGTNAYCTASESLA